MEEKKIYNINLNTVKEVKKIKNIEHFEFMCYLCDECMSCRNDAHLNIDNLYKYITYNDDSNISKLMSLYKTKKLEKLVEDLINVKYENSVSPVFLVELFFELELEHKLQFDQMIKLLKRYLKF